MNPCPSHTGIFALPHGRNSPVFHAATGETPVPPGCDHAGVGEAIRRVEQGNRLSPLTRSDPKGPFGDGRQQVSSDNAVLPSA